MGNFEPYLYWLMLPYYEPYIYWTMFAHYTEQDPASIHHLLPLFVTLFGTLSMYWILGIAWVRDFFRKLITLAKGFFARLK